MTHYVPDIELVKIELDSIDDIDDNAETIVFDVSLNGPPTAKWTDEFDIIYDKTPFPIKPPVFVEGDRLRVHFLPRYERDLQSFVDFLSDMVHRATEEARLTESIKTDAGKEERKRQFRDVLEKIRLREPAGRR